MSNSAPGSPYGQAPQPPSRPPHSPASAGNLPAPPNHTPTGADDNNKQGRIALISGLVGLLIPLLGPVAVVYGFAGLQSAKKGQANNKSSSLAGLILGLLETVGVVVIAIVLVVTLTTGGGTAKSSSSDNPNSAGAQNEDSGQGSTDGEAAGEEDDSDDGDSPSTGGLDTKFEDAKVIGTVDGFEIRAVVAKGTFEGSPSDKLDGKQIPVVKYFVTNMSDDVRGPRFGQSCALYGDLECERIGEFGKVDGRLLTGMDKLRYDFMLPGERWVAIVALGFEESRIDNAEVVLHIAFDEDEEYVQDFNIITPKN